MVTYRTGFDRSSKMESPCEELVKLARLQLSESLEQTRKKNREIAFGLYTTGDKVRFTDSFVSEPMAIHERQIKQVYNQLTELRSEMGEGRMCFVHTHPSGDVRPSPADARYIMTSLADESDPLEDKLDDLPSFDCFYIVGQSGKQGKIRGYILDRPIGVDIFRGLMDQMYMILASSDTSSVEKKKRTAENVISEASRHIDVCESTFNPFKKEYSN